MNQINVTHTALQEAENILKALDDAFAEATVRFLDALSAREDFDVGLGADIDEYAETAKALREKITYFANENIHALDARLSKLSEYESRKYQKRSIG